MNREVISQWHAQLEAGEIAAVRALPWEEDRMPLVVEAKSGCSRSSLIFPGSFNPLHDAHRGMADVAEDLTGRQVAYEISVLNVDKPSTDVSDIIRRLQQFSPQQTVWLTRSARFTQKAACFPGTTFVVGVDTAQRIGDSRYYSGAKDRCVAAIEQIAELGCRLLVFGRVGESGFVRLSQLDLPGELLKICEEVPEATFRHDLSSTELRIAEE